MSRSEDRDMPTKSDILAFIRGTLRRISAGPRGQRVCAEVSDCGDAVVIKRVSRPRGQKSLGANTQETRERALELIWKALEREDVEEAEAGSLTVADVWFIYLSDHLPGLDRSCLETWSRSQATRFATAIVEGGSELPFSVDYLVSVLQVARRLHHAGTFLWDRDIGSIEPGEVLRSSIKRLTQSKPSVTLSTVKTDLGRMRTAIRYVKSNRAKIWGDRPNPLQSMPKLTRKGHVETAVPEIPEGILAAILPDLRENGPWRSWAAASIAAHTGRRIGAIGARRGGTHVDRVPLSGNDFKRDAAGRIESVEWRAELEKNGTPCLVPVSPELAATVEILLTEYPNPLGPDHPLIWSPQNHRNGASYTALLRGLNVSWERVAARLEAAEGKEAGEAAARAHGLAFHGFCRSVVTTVTDEMGVNAAAEYTNRSVETALKYKRTRTARQEEVSSLMGRRLGLVESRGSRDAH